MEGCFAQAAPSFHSSFSVSTTHSLSALFDILQECSLGKEGRDLNQGLFGNKETAAAELDFQAIATIEQEGSEFAIILSPNFLLA